MTLAEAEGMQLILAATAGFAIEVESLLEARADANWATPGGATPLYVAARQGDARVVRALLVSGAEPSATMEDGSSPLFVASWRGHLGAVKALLDAKAPVSQKTNTGALPLFSAAMSGHAGVVELLLQHRATVNNVTQEGVTPLMAAAAAGHARVVKLLLVGRADPFTSGRVGDGETALSVARRNGHTDVFDLMRCILVSRDAGRVAAAANYRSWRAPPAFDWPSIEAAERGAIVELARAATRWRTDLHLDAQKLSRRLMLQVFAGDYSPENISMDDMDCRNDLLLSGLQLVLEGNEHLLEPVEFTKEQEEAIANGTVILAPPPPSVPPGPSVAPPGAPPETPALPYLRIARELESSEPEAAVICRMFAAQLLGEVPLLHEREPTNTLDSVVSSVRSELEEAQARQSFEVDKGEARLLVCLLDVVREAAARECGGRAGARASIGPLAASWANAKLVLDVVEWRKGDYGCVAKLIREEAAREL